MWEKKKTKRKKNGKKKKEKTLLALTLEALLTCYRIKWYG